MPKLNILEEKPSKMYHLLKYSSWVKSYVVSFFDVYICGHVNTHKQTNKQQHEWN